MITRPMGALWIAALVLAAGCAFEDGIEEEPFDDETGEGLGDPGEQRIRPADPAALADDGPSEVNPAWSCYAGQHLHYVDWGSTQVRPQHPSNPGFAFQLQYGHPFCQRSSGSGISYGGYWWVYGWAPSFGAWGWI